MSTHRGVLLTGATGLLGRFLLRDLLTAGQRVTVLARDTTHQHAQERIAEVVAFWGERLGRALPCPTVLAGELGPDGIGLTAADQHWVARHCRTVLHAAACLSFQPTAGGEPFRTNLEGTKSLLALCAAAGVSEWHHVSTAFVCGRRRDTVREEPHDGVSDFHNAYEESKLAAERCLRRAGGLRVTTHRPAIVVGDSDTGYTSNFSGIYRFFELADRLAAANDPGGAGALRQLPVRLPVTGAESCNLVPVDWVSRAIVELLARPDRHGQTFHLVARSPTAGRLLHEVAAAELRLEGVELAGPGGVENPSRLEELVQQGLREFWPYLGGCPAFDFTNTAAALPHLPPPPVDLPLLRRLVRFGVARRWGRGRPRETRAGAACARYVEQVFPRQARASRLARAVGLDILVGLDVRGSGGGQWSCRWTDGELTYVRRGLESRAAVTYHTDATTFDAVVQGRLTPQEAFFERRIAITGDLETALKLAGLFGQFLRENSPSPRHLTMTNDE